MEEIDAGLTWGVVANVICGERWEYVGNPPDLADLDLR